MAAAQKFNPFTENLAKKLINLNGTLKLMLTLVAPVATNGVKADLTEIAAGNGYTAGGAAVTVTSCTQTAGVLKLVLVDVVFTATPASMAPFRYAVLYDDAATNDELVLFWDYGSTITLLAGETFTTDFDASAGALTIT